MKPKIKMVLVGAGFIGREHHKAAQGLDSVLYVAVVDSDQCAAKALAVDNQLPAFTDLAAAISATKPDAVDLCVPTAFHRSLIGTCFDLGCHVLCEKPFVLNVEDGQGIRQAADARGFRVMVAQVIRFWPEYRFMQAAVEHRTYGRVLAVDCKRLSPPPAWNSWMLNEATSGGAVLDLLIHDMDFVLWLLGRPQTILASGRRESGGYNAASASLGYPSGLPVTLEASFLLPQSYPFRMFFRIDCEQATLEMDFWRPKGQRLKIFPADGEAFFPQVGDENAYRAEIDYFAQGLRDDRPFDRVPLTDSIASVELCLAAAQSCTQGRPINVRSEMQ